MKLATIVALGLLAAGLAGCGSSSTSETIAQVGDYKISRAALEHWTPIEAILAYNGNPTSPVPKGVIPDPPKYKACIKWLRSTMPRPHGKEVGPSNTQLERECASKFLELRNHMLEILITYDWLQEEATARHIKISDAEVSHELAQFVHREYPSQAAFHAFLGFTGLSLADERQRIKRNMLASRLLEYARSHAGPAQIEKGEAFADFVHEFEKRWRARTSCHAGYVISSCAPHKSA